MVGVLEEAGVLEGFGLVVGGMGRQVGCQLDEDVGFGRFGEAVAILVLLQCRPPPCCVGLCRHGVQQCQQMVPRMW